MIKSTFLMLLTFFAAIGSCIAQIPERPEDISPLMISEKIPAVQVTSTEGTAALLPDILKEKRSIIVFYRGGWCPFCTIHLSALGQIEEEIIALGYQIIAISPDSPEKLRASVEKEQLNYALYSDGDATLIKAMGLAFYAPEKYHKMLSDCSNAQNPGILPGPSIFVADTAGTILFSYVSPDYKHRISADMLLSVLKHLNEKQE